MRTESESGPGPEESQLIPGLPNDISLSIIARVPRKHHGLIRSVSKTWKNLTNSEEYFTYRETHGLKETWIYALCRDKNQMLCCYVLDPARLKTGWKRVVDLPGRALKRKGIGFEVSKRKIYVLGGCGWIEDASDEVFCYDVVKNCWNEAKSLPVARCYFACESLNDKIYAIGGIGTNSTNPQSYDTYDPTTDTWTSNADSNLIPDTEDSLVLDNKIYIRAFSSAITSHVYAVVYDPLSGFWQHADHDMVSGWRGPGVFIDGEIYVLDQSSGIRVMMWRKEKREWVGVKRLCSLLVKSPCRVVCVGKKMFVIGKGLSTICFDVGYLGNNNKDGVFVTSSISRLCSDDDVVNCKVIGF